MLGNKSLLFFFLGFFLTSRPERVEFLLIGLWLSSAISPTPILTPAMQRCAAILQLRFSFTFHALFSKFSQSSFEFFGQVFYLLNLTGSTIFVQGEPYSFVFAGFKSNLTVLLCRRKGGFQNTL